MRKVFFAGSGFRGDGTALQVMRRLRGRVPGLRLERLESPFDVAGGPDGEAIVVDVVRGIGDVEVFTDVGSFRRTASVSSHDLDTGTALGVLLETGRLRKVTIIGIPQGMDPSAAEGKVRKALSSHLKLEEMG